jgi:HPt (histidine-containing phosphotransfer) domain-containing protein
MVARFIRESAFVASLQPWPADAAQRASVAAQLHKLRGSALVVGARNMARQAAMLEALLQAPARAEPEWTAVWTNLAACQQLLTSSAQAVMADSEAPTQGGHEQSEVSIAALQPEQVARWRQLIARQSLDALSVFDELAGSVRQLLEPSEFESFRTSLFDLEFEQALIWMDRLTVRSGAAASSVFPPAGSQPD